MAQSVTHPLELFHQADQDRSLARGGGDEVYDLDLVFLPVAVDTAHTLLKTVGIPRQIPVDHDAAELKVDSLAGRIGCDHELCIATELFFGGNAVL